MQEQLATEHPELAIDIVHVNEEGYDSGNADLFAVTDLPVVQDDATQQVWTNWVAEWRDVYVLDADNEVYAVFNLTTYTLSDETNYQALYDLFVAASVE